MTVENIIAFFANNVTYIEIVIANVIDSFP